MRVQMFTIFDKKMSAYQLPVYSHNAATMMRSITDSLSRNDNMMSRFPVDYELYCVGEVDDITGVITPLPEKQFVCKLEDLVVKETKDV